MEEHHKQRTGKGDKTMKYAPTKFEPSVSTAKVANLFTDSLKTVKYAPTKIESSVPLTRLSSLCNTDNLKTAKYAPTKMESMPSTAKANDLFTDAGKMAKYAPTKIEVPVSSKESFQSNDNANTLKYASAKVEPAHPKAKVSIV